jgi:hypothetical protein
VIEDQKGTLVIELSLEDFHQMEDPSELAEMVDAIVSGGQDGHPDRVEFEADGQTYLVMSWLPYDPAPHTVYVITEVDHERLNETDPDR